MIFIPYTLKKDRRKQDPYIDKILLAHEGSPKDNSDVFSLVRSGGTNTDLFQKLGKQIKNTGDLNYTISRILWSLFFRTKCYTNAEDLIGVILDVQHRLQNKKYHPSFLCDILFYIIFSCAIGIYVKAEQTLECVKLEMYTRHIRDYEDEKINDPKNGDVNHEWPRRIKRSKK